MEEGAEPKGGLPAGQILHIIGLVQELLLHLGLVLFQQGEVFLPVLQPVDGHLPLAQLPFPVVPVVGLHLQDHRIPGEEALAEAVVGEGDLPALVAAVIIGAEADHHRFLHRPGGAAGPGGDGDGVEGTRLQRLGRQEDLEAVVLLPAALHRRIDGKMVRNVQVQVAEGKLQPSVHRDVCTAVGWIATADAHRPLGLEGPGPGGLDPGIPQGQAVEGVLLQGLGGQHQIPLFRGGNGVAGLRGNGQVIFHLLLGQLPSRDEEAALQLHGQGVPHLGGNVHPGQVDGLQPGGPGDHPPGQPEGRRQHQNHRGRHCQDSLPFHVQSLLSPRRS